MITKDIVTQVATYLKVNVFQLFIDAAKWQDEGVDDQAVREAYKLFVAERFVAGFVYDYCQLIIESIN